MVSCGGPVETTLTTGIAGGMPRSIWNGTVTFGLVAVPIKVHSAVEDRSVHFHQVHAKDGARIKQRRVCAKEGKEVPYEQVAMGYEIANGEYVILAKDEIAAAAGEQSRLIELEEFVGAGDIDPVHYNRPYHLGAGKDGQDSYRLLHDALAKASRVGLGRWVFHNREYLVAVRALDDVLALHTMRFADELVDPGSLDIPNPSRAPSRREVEMAGQLVESLHADFAPRAFRDSYRKRVLELIATKARGEDPAPAEQPEVVDAPDLAAALEASLGGGSRSSASRGKSKSSRGKSLRRKPTPGKRPPGKSPRGTTKSRS
jgi:DNA end-binding protein Ku